MVFEGKDGTESESDWSVMVCWCVKTLKHDKDTGSRKAFGVKFFMFL